MKVPQAKVKLSSVPVEGHSASLTSRDLKLSIGRVQVDEISGTPIYPAGLTAYGRMPDQTEWTYRFRVRDGNRQLSGECQEDVGQVRYYGLGVATLDVRCHCSEGGALKAELIVSRGQGKALLLPSHRFAVYGTRGSEQGKRARGILGYRFQSGASVGAIDVSKEPRAYISTDLPKDQELPLTCLYAGLLLHRPNR